MAKKKSKIKPSTKKEIKEPNFSIDKYIPQKYQTAALLAVILIFFLIYFSPMYFGGKTYQSGDIITSKSLQSYVDKDREDYSLWYPYIFTGMPAYALATDFKWFNLIWVSAYSARAVFTAAFEADYAKWTFYLLLLAFTSYFLINYLTKNRLLGLFGGLATSFSTGIILFLFIGHVTKLTALAFYPLIFLMLLKFQHKITLRDFALLIIVTHLSFLGWHVQIIFYTLLSIGIYFAYFIIRSLIQKDSVFTKQMFKSLATFAGAFLIALAIQSDNLTQIYEYNPYSTRGSESILDKVKGTESQKSDTDFYQYATNWSFSPGEVMTFVFPSFYGFGSSTYQGPLTKNQEVEVNTYFGQMPFVDVAMYMGVIVFFLALFGIYSNRKNPYVQYLTILIVFSLLVSFGRTFPVVYDLMFNFFPFFDKFRVPSMILVLVQLSLPVLAALGIKRIIELRKESNSQLENIIKYSAFALSGLFVVSLLLNSAITGWFSSRVTDYAALMQTSRPQMAQQFSALKDYMAEMFISDVYFAFILSAAVFWIAYAFIKRKVAADAMILAIIVLSMIDLIRINDRGAKFQETASVENLFNAPPYVQYLKSQNSPEPYRIFNIKQDGSLGSINQNSNYNASFFLQDFYGYSSIKPRTYQDFIDVVGPVNNTLWNMLNVKYIISDKPFSQPGFNLELVKQLDKSLIYENSSALPRAFLVDSVAKAESIDFLNMVAADQFDPEKVAFIHDDEIAVDKPDSSAYASIIKYEDERIEIEVSASGNNLLFIGDTYYPKGWSAEIDGSETKVYRINHGYRGVVVPEGKHKVVLTYLPTSFVISEYLALIFSTLAIGGLILGLVLRRKEEKTEDETNN